MAGIAKVFSKSNAANSYSPGLLNEIMIQITNLVTDVETLRAYVDHRFKTSPVNVEFIAAGGAVLARDGNVYDIQSTVVVPCNHAGAIVDHIPDAIADVSVLLGTGKAITNAKSGVLWVYNRAGGADLILAVSSAAEANATDIAALAQPIPAPPAVGDVPLGCVMVTASATWEWGSTGAGRLGTDSSVDTFYDFLNPPTVLVEMASFALDASAATFTYGAANAVLGDGTQLVISGEANHVFPAGELDTIADNAVGAWVLYCLADNDAIPVQIGNAYEGLRAAKIAVENLRPNPLLVKLGEIYVTNASGAVFTPATTNLDATGITVEFVTESAAVELAPKATDMVASNLSLS